MALELARSMVEHGRYDADRVFEAYQSWLDSGPFDCGTTILNALNGRPNHPAANGAMMRASPLGIFGVGMPPEDLAALSMQDAALTHPHPVCQQSNALFVLALAHVIRTGATTSALYQQILHWCNDFRVEKTVFWPVDAVELADGLLG